MKDPPHLDREGVQVCMMLQQRGGCIRETNSQRRGQHVK